MAADALPAGGERVEPHPAPAYRPPPPTYDDLGDLLQRRRRGEPRPPDPTAATPPEGESGAGPGEPAPGTAPPDAGR